MAINNIQRSTQKLAWNELAVSKIERFEQDYINKIPHIYDCFSQSTQAWLETKVATCSSTFAKMLTPLANLNAWLATDELQQTENTALKAYGIFLLKLPLRAVSNIIKLLINILTAVGYTLVHPVKALGKLAIVLVNLIKALTEPDTWSKMGAGILGATLGQAAVGNPLAPIGLIVGATMMGIGISGAILDALLKKKEVSTALFNQFKQIPEAFLTGFLMGLLFGAINKARNAIEQQKYQEHLKELEKNKWTYAQQNSPQAGRVVHNLPSGGAVERVSNTFISNVQVQGDSITWTQYQSIKTTTYIRVYPYTGPDSIRIITSITRTPEIARTLSVPFHFSFFNPSSLAQQATVATAGAAASVR